MSETCRVAQEEVEDAQIEQGSKSFFSFNKLRTFFTEQKIREILLCDCSRCKEDLQVIPSRIDRESYVDIIMGSSDPQNLVRTFYSVFGLLVHAGHPLFIIGFLDHNCNDYMLESWTTYHSDFSNDRLQSLTGNYYRRHPKAFSWFVRKFLTDLPKFAIPRLEPVRFLQYRESVILPFVDEVEIGKRQVDGGHWTSEGANGRVFAFKIQREYNRFTVETRLTQTTPGSAKYIRTSIQTPNSHGSASKHQMPKHTSSARTSITYNNSRMITL